MRFLSRRQFVAIGSSAAALGLARAGQPSGSSVPPLRIRTITAGVSLSSVDDFARIRATLATLKSIKTTFESNGFAVQSVRLATQPLAEYLPDWRSESSIAALVKLDALAVEYGVGLSLGPVINQDESVAAMAAWARKLIEATARTNFSVSVASTGSGVHQKAIMTAAEVMTALSRGGISGQNNFRFVASACIPAGTPFFPAAWHSGEDGFSIGLETPKLLYKVFSGPGGIADAGARLKVALDAALSPIESIALKMSEVHRLRYAGLDASPAPGPDASIGEAIETLTGKPFGSASTLAACAAITSGLKKLSVKTCGYSGLMLPVVEDKVLAERASQGLYGISELLLYSSVCGTGLDVVPLPGDLPVDTIARIIGDVAALSVRYSKPLSARLLLVPGRSTGERVDFNHPMLTGSRVFSPD